MAQLQALAWHDPRDRMLTLFILCSTLLLLLSSCNVTISAGEKGSGNVLRQTRAVAAFKAIYFDGVGDLYIDQAASSAVSVETDDNFIERIETEVRDGILYIQTRAGQSISNPTTLRYNVSVGELEALTIDGAGDTYIEGLSGDRLRISASGAADASIRNLNVTRLAVTMDGSGDLDIAGTVDEQQVTLNGAATYLATDLQSRVATVSTANASNANVSANEQLDVTISGASSVEYSGNPELRQDVRDAGSLRRHSQ